MPRQVFLGKVNQRASNIRVVWDESLVEVGEAKEGVDIFDFSWSGPTCDAIKLNRVHGQLSWFDDHSEVFDFISGELAFFKFQVEV